MKAKQQVHWDAYRIHPAVVFHHSQADAALFELVAERKLAHTPFKADTPVWFARPD